MENKLIKNIVRQFQDIQEQELWLDENFKKKVDNLPEKLAFERPLPDLHSAAELISHILAWRKDSILKLKGQSSLLTMESSENWLTNEILQRSGWEKLKSEFYNSQKEIIELIENETDDYLEREYIDGYKFKFLLEGLIHHDLYHLGQLGIVIKFLNLKK
ncbi:DinB family protein [Aquiflexum lacus]|uniref:DinB family protein n=1 Tax=Aquiflexum lacus TaxID=2483805 RepID=UPI001893BB82|nr:DinB family protein [Aquiflexum lacus]